MAELVPYSGNLRTVYPAKRDCQVHKLSASQDLKTSNRCCYLNDIDFEYYYTIFETGYKFCAMLTVISIMTAGILAGFFLRNREKWKWYNAKLTMVAIYALLFVLGISIGSNQEIIQNLPKLGWVALLITLASVLGSIVAAGFFYKKFIKPSQKA